MAEKRRSPRVAVTALAEVTLPDGNTLSSYVANMSREGLGVYFQKPLATGTELTIKLTYRDNVGKLRTKEVAGEVKWAYNGFYAIGIALKGLSEKEHADLLQYIESVEERNQL